MPLRLARAMSHSLGKVTILPGSKPAKASLTIWRLQRDGRPALRSAGSLKESSGRNSPHHRSPLVIGKTPWPSAPRLGWHLRHSEVMEAKNRQLEQDRWDMR